jgi:hypothetical protein
MWSQLAGPGTREPKLGSLGRDVIGKARISQLKDLAPDLYDPSISILFHVWNDGFEQQQWGLYKKLKLIQIAFPRLFFNCQERLRSGCIHDKRVDRTKLSCHFVFPQAQKGLTGKVKD